MVAIHLVLALHFNILLGIRYTADIHLFKYLKLRFLSIPI